MTAFDLTPPTDAQRTALIAGLSEDERRVLLQHGTEAPFCGVFLDNKQDGVYTCRLCGLPLFRSSAKFDSGTGWPSFFQPVDEAHVGRIHDSSYGMVRTEIVCARCQSHLGHVFPDGPKPTGLRYCLNSVALGFVGNDEPLPDPLGRGEGAAGWLREAGGKADQVPQVFELQRQRCALVQLQKVASAQGFEGVSAVLNDHGGVLSRP